LARVTRAALQSVRYGPAAITSAIDEAILDIIPQVKKRVDILWGIANIATLVGLIGTIIGLIGAFKALGPLPPEKKTEVLTKGISEAMNNTAFGLSIAVACIAAHMVLSGSTKKIAEGTEYGSVRVENILTRLRTQQNLRDKAAKT
jgi:biopolymer transport protein ExbB/TolQ